MKFPGFSQSIDFLSIVMYSGRLLSISANKVFAAGMSRPNENPRNAHKRSQLYGWDPVQLCAYRFRVTHLTNSDPAQSHVEYFLDCVLYMDEEL